MTLTTERTALINVRVFDGHRLSEPRTVVLDGQVIGTDATGARSVDADGKVLLPGLIDAHIHLHGVETLEHLTSWGVTTGLDMATWPANLVDSLRSVDGLTDIRSAGLPVIGPAGPHSHFGMPPEAVVSDPNAADSFVAARIAEGVDYIKIVLEAPGAGGPEPAVAQATVNAAHRYNKKVVAHASSVGAYALALEIGADFITHVPNGDALGPDIVATMLAQAKVAVPTLTMMHALADHRGNIDSFAAASRSVGDLHRAGVPILAGTDASVPPEGLPHLVVHGDSLHHELELLVAAGLSTTDALQAATALPAHYFGLTDRGVIEPGMRADLVLIDGDPIADIRATRNITQIWCAGVEHTPATRNDTSPRTS
ncbi:amidohydrolase family protein [Rhodococcus sp. G-MC3]|uniref:amidohydrolase family protein n=1 Tax=Rhodococcus sp. G-MC3 TaxID=3046209 RepID=UPI0024BBCAD2|nr:amidohydrolase family protein [Rhodococcus sp. G-MC3]MDJ0396402.1 amidohydrolase family protein [Rhodococcus sp. G-MC3]